MKRVLSVLCSVATLAAGPVFAGPAGRQAAALPPQAATAPQRAALSTTDNGAKTWMGHEPEVEEFLRSAPIVSEAEVPIGVTKPKRLYFAPGGPVASAAWKPLAPGMKQGYLESYKAEIAAYEMDKLLGMHMVPPYVERRVKGDLGAVAFWVENVHGWSIDHPVRGPDPVAWDLQVIRMKMFDQLIGNIDRNQGNLLYDDQYHLILIDHSRAFTGSKDIARMSQFTRVDGALWEKMLALDETQLASALGKWLDKGKLRAIFARRDRMKKNIDRMVAQKGEAAVVIR